MTTWSATANASTSGGNLTITSTGASGRGFTSIPIPSGSAYMELVVNDVTTSFGVGVANTSESSYVGGTANSAGFLRDGNIYTNNAYVTTVKVDGFNNPTALVVSDRIRIATIGSTGKLWMACNSGVFNTYLTGDPAAGTGAVDISTVTGTQYLYFEADASGPGITANFGLSAFTYSIPTGFSAWDVAAGGVLWRPVSPLILR